MPFCGPDSKWYLTSAGDLFCIDDVTLFTGLYGSSSGSMIVYFRGGAYIGISQEEFLEHKSYIMAESVRYLRA